MSVETTSTLQTDNLAEGESCPDVEIVIRPRTRDLGGFTVGRVLPFAKRRMVGPFIFFDEMGPADFPAGAGIDVRPHPHIGLATVTYLFEGEIRHRDSLGFDQIIRPGDVNWMTAGRGIVHSERTDAGLRAKGRRLHGIQSWVALPEAHEEAEPAFHHHPKASLPVVEGKNIRLRLIAGRAYGETSPVKTFSEMFYLAGQAESGAALALPEDHAERALHLVSGALDVNGTRIEAGRMLVFRDGAAPDIRVADGGGPARFMLLGGAPLGLRHIWWNLVSSSQDRIEQAKRDWARSAEAGFRNAPFALPPDEREFIPLPER
ncbi:pirin family protein [Amphiplicatus metriothermophilus]|uniref:Pirin n=1 Tax=Amphiplicatus metriothermophilus TaxID=1519374 RepID=A0A239PTI5_9PROT|nr:pirin family protein [Amphiplicatus metriothermophilus]MBB5519173.1 hypothetical protein [Amphiplicatus metriothermophilus]SNT73242.1 hypothetical protein SAMN06297382_1640 [Amphiplicatus metriothermophilus]